MRAILGRHKQGLVITAVVLVAITLAAYFWLPGVVKNLAQEKLSELLEREVTVQEIRITPSELSLTLHGLNIAANPRSPDTHLLGVGSLKMDFSRASITERLPIFDELVIESPSIHLSRDAQGRLNIADLIEKLAAPKPQPSEPLKFALHNIRLTKGSVTFTDGITKRKHELTDLAITIPLLSNQPISPEIWTEPHVSGKLNGATFAIDGKTHLFGARKEASIQLALDHLDLAGLEKYANVLPEVAVQSAKLSTKLDIRFSHEPGKASSVAVAGKLSIADAAIAYRSDTMDWLIRGAATYQGQAAMDGKPLALTGDAAIENLSVLDQANANEIARWKSVRIAQLQLSMDPFTAGMASVDIDGLFARPTILSDGRLNLAGRASPAPTKTSANGAAKPKGLPVDIGKVTIANSSMIFSDQFTKPNFRANLTNLKGSIGRLSAGTQTPIEISGTIDRTAPLQIQGRIDPFNQDIFLDLIVKAKGIEMPPLSPYSIKYLAYPIEKGKLSLDLQYQLNHGELKAENKIFLDQLTLGDRIESPDALSIPVSLAVALLKNFRGEIDINLPISGSINDPHFKIGPIVFKALMNLIVKAATAPFTIIASLFGHQADISKISFAPGLTRPDAEAEKVLGSIAKAMVDRPALKLEITGTADPITDVEGAKRAILQRRIRAEKVAELAAKGKTAESLRDIEISKEEYPRLLAEVYKKSDIKKPRNIVGLAKTLPVEDMEKLLADSIAVADADLLVMADQRSRNVRAWLAKEGVPAERVFVLTSHLEAASDKPGSGAARFALR